jgi:hypothetical protein
MGINSDKSPMADFMANKTVSRAEFWTVLSRLLWGTTNEGGTNYYTHHLEALKAAWIISNDNPTLKEVRGYIFLMLMRSAQE